MSINQLYELSRRSFRTYDAAMQTTSDNIANAGTEGFHRRRITRSAEALSAPGIHMGTPPGSVTGAGVSVQSYERMRDAMMEHASWEAQGGLGSAEEEARLLGAVEGIFATGSEGNLTDVLGQFFDAWGDVASNPTDAGVRQTLLHQAETLTSSFHRLGDDLSRFQTETQSALEGNIDEINGLLSSIADANVTIREARLNGSPDYAAADQRDQQISELAKLVPLQVQETDQGYNVSVQGHMLVQGDAVQSLELSKDTPPNVLLADSTHTLSIPGDGGGKLGAQLRTLHETLPGLRSDLDAVADTVVEQVNGAHRNGYGLDGSTNLAFFTPDLTVSPGPITATNIELNLTDPQKIAAMGTGPGGNPLGDGDATQANTIAGFREAVTGNSIDLMTDVGSRASKASSQVNARQAVVDHLDGVAQGISRVSIDEEMTKLIEHQQMFQASARVLSTAERMMDTLLAM